jgi:adenylate cyclase
MSEKNTILVVDDNEMNRDMLARRLKRQGFMVDVAENGQVALDKVDTGQYALLLLDVMMPRLNGFEVLERMKTNDATRHIPVIMISAIDDLESVVKCIQLGAEDYLFKPFNPILLKARVEAALRRVDASRQLLSPEQIMEATHHLESAITLIEGQTDPEIIKHLVAVHTLLRDALVD